MKNLHKKFIEETGQILRYVSWKHNRKIKKSLKNKGDKKNE